MPHNQNHLYALKDGKTVFIDDVPNGNKCGCVCSKCKEPLIARNGGEINIHHFSHKADSKCSGESLAHIKAKEIIQKEKYLWVPFNDYEWNEEYEKSITNYKETDLGDLPSLFFDSFYKKKKDRKIVDFDRVDVEAYIGKTKYTADLICYVKDKPFLVEIIVTHDLEPDKAEYITKNQISTLNIDLGSVLEKGKYNDLPPDFSELVLKKATREWFYNKKESEKLQDKKQELEKKYNDFSKKLQIKKEEYDRKEKEETSRRWKNFEEKQAQEQQKIRKALSEINKKNGEKLIYGKLVRKDIRKFGEREYESTLCVESPNLSKEFDNLAKVVPNTKYDNHIYSKIYFGRKVGVIVIPSVADSLLNKHYNHLNPINIKEYKFYYFPKCEVQWTELDPKPTPPPPKKNYKMIKLRNPPGINAEIEKIKKSKSTVKYYKPTPPHLREKEEPPIDE